jgi:5'-nucleotidase
MRILVTNDDGIQAPGIRVLVEAAQKLGEVKVVAPDRERSACGHSMTMRDPLRITDYPWEGAEAFEVNGVPTDCVALGIQIIWENQCDLVLSGINSGPNLGFDVTYSGTAAGAMEGVIQGVPSIAVSMASLVSGAPIHFETARAWLAEQLEKLVKLSVGPLTFLNVNIPNFSDPIELRGRKVVPMGKRVYENRIEQRVDPWGRPYYWQGGVAVLASDQPGTDVEAVNQGFVSITPVSVNWTDQSEIDRIKSTGLRA